MRPNLPNAAPMMHCAEQIQINFDESQDGETANANAIAYSADNFLLRNDAIIFHKKEKGYKQRIEELELELALAKERMMIGAEIVRNLVLDTNNSVKYFVQSFELITESSSKQMERNNHAKRATSKQTRFVHEGVTQNVPKKTPKLITKNKRSLRDLNKAAEKDSRGVQIVLSDVNDEVQQEQQIIEERQTVQFNSSIRKEKSKIDKPLN